MSERGPVAVEARERARVVYLQQGANAMDDTLMQGLARTLDSLADGGAPAVVLASRHPTVFCPGLDLKQLVGCSRAQLKRAMDRFSALLRQLVVYPGPTVAALAGHAIGGGCSLALACDRRVMARAGVRIGLSEVNLGIPPPAGSVTMLLALYQARAVEQLVLEGDGLGGERAVELGLVERLADPGGVLDDAVLLAARLASRPPAAYAAAKRFLRHGLSETMEKRDAGALECFLDHWFDEATQERLRALVGSMGGH